MVLFLGELREGIDRQKLKSDMAETFHVSPAKIESLFTGRPQVIKNDLSEAEANLYRDTLKSLGAVSWVEPVPPFYGKYTDRRKNSRNRRGDDERRSDNRLNKLSQERRKSGGRRYHDK